MRAIVRAILICNAALLWTATGCTGSGPKPQTGKAIAKSEQQTVVKESQATVKSEQAAATQAADRGNEAPAAGNEAQASGEPVAKESTPEPPKQITALRAPTVLPAVMPEVVLSAAHADDCLIRVGDALPDFRLPDLMGRMRSLAELQGDSLTVVVFWSGDRLLAADQLRYLSEYIARYSHLGVGVVAINVGQSPERVRKIAQELQLEVPMLLDLDRGSFSRVGKTHLPRTYLLDGDGHVLWLDIEFSRHTRDGLEQAINASLQST